MIANVLIESFPPEVRHRLGWYVHRLIDPRNGETFQTRVSPQLGSAQHSPNVVSTPLCVHSGHPARLPIEESTTLGLMAGRDAQPPEFDDRGRMIGARESKIEKLRGRLGVRPRMPRRIHSTSRWHRLMARFFG
jgi:hypothetical protein